MGYLAEEAVLPGEMTAARTAYQQGRMAPKEYVLRLGEFDKRAAYLVRLGTHHRSHG